ncbi:MAG: hypothetical protein HZC04_01610 [Candidatus Lloydbacteria bacterium]|nr:hypothetical protein [Candidatus Lloydbacteria bacterium]
MFALNGCALEKYAREAETKPPPQATAHGEESFTEEDPFEKDSPSVECFENEEAIKKAYERLKKARESLLAALSLPSFSFYTLEHAKTHEKKTVFTENHILPPPFNNESEWRVIKEDTAKIKTIATCALMLELQKF